MGTASPDTVADCLEAFAARFAERFAETLRDHHRVAMKEARADPGAVSGASGASAVGKALGAGVGASVGLLTGVFGAAAGAKGGWKAGKVVAEKLAEKKGKEQANNVQRMMGDKVKKRVFLFAQFTKALVANGIAFFATKLRNELIDGKTCSFCFLYYCMLLFFGECSTVQTFFHRQS